MPVAEARNNSQTTHCKALGAGKAGSTFQTRIELSYSKKDVACLFQAFGLVHKRTPVGRKFH
jgi:hypothetical protein